MSDSDVEMKEKRVNPPTKSSKKQNPSRQRAQKKRHEGFRNIKNKEFTAKQDALIKSKLQPLFELEQMQSLNALVPVVRTVPVPVSTRAIGFSLYETVRGAFGVNPTINITRAQLLAVYRYLHCKIAAKWMSSSSSIIDRQMFIVPNVPEAIRNTIKLDAWIPLLM